MHTIQQADIGDESPGRTSKAGNQRGREIKIGSVNVLATLIAITFVDRLARRNLLVAGLTGNSLTCWLFTSFCGVAWVWLDDHVPETRGQSLEQIQQLRKVAP